MLHVTFVSTNLFHLSVLNVAGRERKPKWDSLLSPETVSKPSEPKKSDAENRLLFVCELYIFSVKLCATTPKMKFLCPTYKKVNIPVVIHISNRIPLIFKYI